MTEATAAATPSTAEAAAATPSKAESTTRVDMMAEAREAQWSAATFLGPDAIRLIAPAKVNLFLAIGKRRPDGYHEATTVMHALALHDTLYMNAGDGGAEENADGVAPDGSVASGTATPADSDTVAFAGPARSIAVRIDMADKTGACAGIASGGAPTVPVKDNLVFKAIDALAREVDRVQPGSIDIRIEKCIPAQAGLGGGSSDAAAAILGAAHLWGLEPTEGLLHRVAASLGADVAFFLKGGCGFFTGVGERFERALQPMKHPVLLVKPASGVSTAQAYEAFDQDPAPVPAETLAQADDASIAEAVPLFNNLTPAAQRCLPELADIAAWLMSQPGVAASPFDGTQAASDTEAQPAADSPRVLLSGSGSALFAQCRSTDAALRLAAEAGKRGLWARATTFSSLRAALVG